MKTIGSIVLVLIAGILSPTNAESNELFRESECNINGGPEAYDNMKINTENIGNNTVQPILRRIMRAYYGNGNNVALALTVYCGKVENLNNAIINYVEAIKPCLKPEYREIPGLSNITASILQFPCANRNLVEAILNSANRELCLSSSRRAMINCEEDMHSNLNTTMTTSTSRRETACSHIQTFEQCTVRVLEECEDKIFSTTLDSWYKYVNNDIPCENLPKSPK